MHFLSFGRTSRARAIWLLGIGALSSLGFAQLRVATWNVTNFTSTESTARKAAFQTAIFGSFQGRSMNPDVLVAQEMQGSASVTSFLAMLNSAPGQSGQWAAATPFLTTGDSDSAFFYRTNKVQFQSLANIAGDPRSTQRYDFKLLGYDASSTTNPLMSLYSSHLKSGTATGGSEESRRLFEARNIRTDAATQSAAGRNVLLGGDFNIGTSNDDSYRALIDASTTNNSGATVTNGRFHDPINSSFTSTGATVTWNNNNAYRFLHTQDPYGAGGMDDRMDFILTGSTMRDGKGLEYVGSTTAAYSTTTWNDPNHSYRAWGNDGTSFNSTINTTNNAMVGNTIAAAIRDSVGNSNPNNVGGHLPIFLDLKLPADLKVAQSSLNFGTALIGSTSQLSVDISNAVDAAIWGASGVQNSSFSLSLSGTGFTLPTGGTLAAGGSVAKLISMDTTSTGIRNAVLQITDNATGQMRTVNLSGIVAVPEPATMAALGLGVAGLLRRKRK
ncbi:MAG: endonuclease/exonuclease/phosphatase family protein [Armatimonadota bacterium]